MAPTDRLARVLPTDRLFRKLRADQWHPQTLSVYPAAFVDRYEKLSLSVEGIGDLGSPLGVLQSFCGFPYARKFCPPHREPTPEDLLDAGEGIAILPAYIIVVTLKLTIVPDPGTSCHIRSNGHINVQDARDYALLLARTARALTREQILGTAPLPLEGSP